MSFWTEPYGVDIDCTLTETFGVEIECIAKVSFEHVDKLKVEDGLEIYKDRDPCEDREMVENAIWSTLNEAGIAVNLPNSTEGDDSSKEKFEAWSIEEDRSIVPFEETQGPETKENKFGYFGFEIKSRILQVDSACFEEVRLVLSLLKSRVKLMTNMSCGLHVHVGNASKGYPVRTLKNFAHLVTGLELEIHRLHPDERAVFPGTMRWCFPPSQLIHASNPYDRWQAIESAQTLANVRNVMNPCLVRNAAYNFLHLTLPGEDIGEDYQTIEFRQHAASVDADEILAWVQLITAMVKYSHHLVSLDELFDLCINCATDESFTVLDLMILIGQEDLVNFYGKRLHPRQRPIGLSASKFVNSDIGQPLRHKFWMHMGPSVGEGT